MVRLATLPLQPLCEDINRLYTATVGPRANHGLICTDIHISALLYAREDKELPCAHE